MNYTMMLQGDCLPMVGVLQHLLNRTGFSVATDGIFGPRTRAAVVEFQRKHQPLIPDGIVGEKTWERLTAGVTLPILDAIDIYDPTFDDTDATFIRQAGGNPLVIGGMCNGVEQIVSMIVGAGRNVFLLRFHGHGGPGIASVSEGHVYDALERCAITTDPVILGLISRLRQIFGPYGCVQFIQCQTGRGPNGRALLQKLANILLVPVIAAVNDQPFTKAATFRLTGPVVTCFPNGHDLKSWSQSRPAFPGMSVM